MWGTCHSISCWGLIDLFLYGDVISGFVRQRGQVKEGKMPPQKKYPTQASTTYTVGNTTFREIENFTSSVNIFPMGKQIVGRYLHLVRRQAVGTVSKPVAKKVARYQL